MKTFADWLRHYNNLDVIPGMEVLQKMRHFYTEKGIDRYWVSTGVSMHYLLRSVEYGANLWSPCEEEYKTGCAATTLWMWLRGWKRCKICDTSTPRKGSTF